MKWIKKFLKYIKMSSKIKSIGLMNNEANVDINTKFADNIENKTQIACTNNVDNSKKEILVQNFYSVIMSNFNNQDSINKALGIGNNNAQIVGKKIQDLIELNNISQENINEKLANPEILMSLAEGNRIAYKTSDTNKRKILADLIFQKITSEDDELSNTLSLGIKTMENLTNNHLKTIAFLYLIHSNYIKNKISYDEFKNFYYDYIVKLIDFPIKDAAGIGRTIIANGAAVTYTFGWDIFGHLPERLSKKSGQYGSDVNPDIRGITENLSHFWNSLGTTSAVLTPLGECLGKMYLFNILGLSVEK